MCIKRLVLAGIASMLISMTAYAASDANFPSGWDGWPITKSGAIPDNKTAIPADVPPILKETIKTYNWVNDGKGSAYNVRVNPSQKEASKAGNGFSDGATAVLELTDIKVLLVTEHLLGGPQYGAYTYDGKDMSDAHPSLGTKVCITCHSGYKEACKDGVCSQF